MSKNKEQDKQLEKLLFEVYYKGVKQQDCNLTECIENVKQALRIHDVIGSLPTDEDIEKVAKGYDNSMSSIAESIWMPKGFKEGAKWMRKKLIGQ